MSCAHVSRGFLFGRLPPPSRSRARRARTAVRTQSGTRSAGCPGAVVGGDTGDVAATTTGGMPEDVALMAELGLDAYRFSVAWPRVRPTAARSTRPGSTSTAWSTSCWTAASRPWADALPLGPAAGARGAGRLGLPRHRIPLRRLRRARLRGARRPGADWTTLNEPWCSAFLGYAAGGHAPGPPGPEAAVAAVHHLLLAARARHGGDPRAGRGRRRWASHSTCHRSRPPTPTTRRTSTPWPHRRPAHPDLPRPGAARRVPRRLRRSGRRSASTSTSGRRPRASAPRSTCSVSTTTPAHVRSRWSRRRAAPGVGPELPVPWIGSEHVGFVSRGLPRTGMDWEVAAPGCAACWCGCTTIPDVRRSTSPRTAPPTRRRRRRRQVHDADRIDYMARTCAPRTRRSRQGVDLRGYLCGRCSTTSSGRGDTRSGSASSASTTPPSPARRRRALGSSPQVIAIGCRWTKAGLEGLRLLHDGRLVAAPPVRCPRSKRWHRVARSVAGHCLARGQRLAAGVARGA